MGASARIEGPMTLLPGARGTYTLVITSTRSDFMTGGFNIAASGATLARNGTVGQLMSGELTHTAPVARSGAEVRVPFDVVAPATAGNAMLFAAGNATNGGRNAANDAWALAAFAVSIGAAPTDAGAATDASTITDAGAATDAGAITDTGITADTGPRIERYDPTASSGYGGCRTSPGGARGGGLGALALLGLTLARRRSRCATR
jgi:MYXO-CTERM domain-containing protein